MIIGHDYLHSAMETKQRGGRSLSELAVRWFGNRKEHGMKIVCLAGMAALILCGCQGPGEKAGAAKDKAEAEAAGRTYDGDGPNERIGAARDRAADAAADARRAEERAIERKRDAIRSEADIEAERLEQEAEKIREAAKARAEAVEAPVR